MRGRSGILASVLLASCGGGSGGGDGATLTGDFYVAMVEATASPDVDAASRWGTAVSDGSSLSLLTASNANGVVSVPSPGLFGLDVGADGVFRLREAFSGDVVLRGCVGAGRRIAVAASVRDGDRPALFAMLRRGEGTASDGDLAGDYHTTFFAYDGSGRCVVGTATFDGAGGGTLPAGALANVDGGLVAANLSAPVLYGVDADGTLNLSTVFGGNTFQGQLDASGDFAVLGGSTATGSPGLFVLVRQSTTATAATFDGTYCMAGLDFDYATPAMRSFAGRIVSDGVASATVDGTIDTDGTLTSQPATATPYTVTAAGSLVVTTPGGTLQGAVSPTGEFAVLGGATSALGDPQIYLLVR